MKEIDLIKYESYSINIPPEAIGLQGIEESCSVEISKKRSGKTSKIELKNPITGEIIVESDVVEGDNELTQARKNGSQVIYATIVIENKLNDIIANYLFSEHTPNSKRDFFINEILCTSHITFAAKKALALRIVDDLKFFGNASSRDKRRKNKANTERNNLNKLLKDTMIYRNAFAHGKLKYEAPRGCVLHYYSGEQKKLVLDDVFWMKIEKAYASIDDFLRKIEKSAQTVNSNL